MNDFNKTTEIIQTWLIVFAYKYQKLTWAGLNQKCIYEISADYVMQSIF